MTSSNPGDLDWFNLAAHLVFAQLAPAAAALAGLVQWNTPTHAQIKVHNTSAPDSAVQDACLHSYGHSHLHASMLMSSRGEDILHNRSAI